MQHQSAKIRLKINISLGGEEHPPQFHARGLVERFRAQFGYWEASILGLISPKRTPNHTGRNPSPTQTHISTPQTRFCCCLWWFRPAVVVAGMKPPSTLTFDLKPR